MSRRSVPWISSGPAQRPARGRWWVTASDYFFGAILLAFLAMCLLLAGGFVVNELRAEPVAKKKPQPCYYGANCINGEPRYYGSGD